jgi:penicillin-insensitive murein DD-endopeptidase
MRAVRRPPRLLWIAAAVAAIAIADPPASRAGGAPNPWAAAREPSTGEAHAIGGTSAGCLAGAARIPRKGRGFRVMVPARRRYYTHPVMAAFLRDLGDTVASRRLGLLPLGDLSQPRGGPAPTGHASHQTGLDVDIWYAIAKGARAAPVPMVTPARGSTPAAIASAWSAANAEILALAAADPRVDRIFVNPVIKQSLCATATGDRAWLHKLRPWWGHDEHFHVRLACPAPDTACERQAEIPDGDGCPEIDWWLSPDRQTERATQRQTYRKKIGTLPPLPAACAMLLDD